MPRWLVEVAGLLKSLGPERTETERSGTRSLTGNSNGGRNRRAFKGYSSNARVVPFGDYKENGMSFAPKNRKRYNRIQARQDKITALASTNTPEARKARKAMNTQYHGEPSGMLGESWNPNGKRIAKGSNVKCDKINNVLRQRGTI